MSAVLSEGGRQFRKVLTACQHSSGSRESSSLTRPFQPISLCAQMPPWREGARRLWLATLILCAPPAHGAEAPATPPAQPEPTPSPEPGAPRTVVRIFGDIDWRTRRELDPSTFVLGQIDVFLTSELATNVSVLAETVLESPEDDRSQIAEVERFQLQYSPADALTVSVGRMHTMLGFWNQAYHHGTWLQTPAFRPEIYRWEDDEQGGLLPVHEVGVRLSGAATMHPLRLEYAATVVNGRACARARCRTCRSAVPRSSTRSPPTPREVERRPWTSASGAASSPSRGHGWSSSRRRSPSSIATTRPASSGRAAGSTRRPRGRRAVSSPTTASTGSTATRATRTTGRGSRTSRSTPPGCASTPGAGWR
jgi:hypothetical protein